MRKNTSNRKRALYGSTALRSLGGRIMKGDDRSGVGDTGQNNDGGNADDSGGDNQQQQNNGGQSFDAAKFWDEPGEETPTSETPTPTPAPTPTPTQGDAGKNLGTQLTESLTGLKFGDMFNAEIADQISKGDLTGANARFGELAQDVVKQSVVMSTTVVKAAMEHMRSEFKSMIADSLGGEKNDAALIAAFPAAKNPAVYKTINGIFQQAMKHSKNDRTKATEMTRDMLKFVGKETGTTEAPTKSNDGEMTDNSKSLVESLLSFG